ncbi:intercellular trafficking and secretion [Tulasnella sp. 419]|nr:intercellular trafficking and secretion [Tulasnella sp. 418]KAG8958962.1 intercellular trafficking and secretion [Tulasnella sp. 419]
MDDNDVFDSVAWEQETNYPQPPSSAAGTGGYRSDAVDDSEPGVPKWEGYLLSTVADPIRELEGTKDMYVSYKISAKTNLPMFSSQNPTNRRRFQDFTFLRDNLVKLFPACVVPPLPGKHRLEYVTGDRFSQEFIEKRKLDLQRFLDRLGQHPTLQRAKLLRDFFESTEWTVTMHQHMAHPPGPEPAPSILENLSDTLLNAFSRVRKPDERFLDMKEKLDKFEEGLVGIDRTWTRIASRTTDLSQDYHDLAVSVQGLGFLESGITEPLNRFSHTLLEFSALLRHDSQANITPFLHSVHSLLAYSHENRAVLRLRDQKQLDFEDLTEYLQQVTIERDRLAARSGLTSRAPITGASGLGLGAYLRDKVESIRGGVDDERTRVEKMKKLDSKIKELENEVTMAQETSEAFSDETLKEQNVFHHAKSAEMKEALGALADGQIEMYKQAMEEWDRIIPIMQRIRVDV